MFQSLIYLAPASLHLALYDRILKERGSCLGVTVLTLESYLARSLVVARQPRISVLYQYKEALEDLSPDNTFYGSRADYDFLSACYQFMMLAQLHDLRDFPAGSRRDRDLREIIDLLLPIDLWVREAAKTTFEDAKNVRILECETDWMQRFFIRRLLEQGAQMVSRRQHERFAYWAVSNPRKEMEACADAIVKNRLPASSVMVALSDPGERYVLAQAFDSRKIPYTFTSQAGSDRVVDAFKAALSYVIDPSRGQLMRLLKKLFGQNALDVCRFYDLTGSLDLNLSEKPWRENTLIDAEDYTRLQAMEAQARAWKPTIAQIERWNIDSFDEIETIIQSRIPDPDETDLAAAQAVRDSFEPIRPFVKSRDDLRLFVRSLDTIHARGALRELDGVLIGSRREISCLHDFVFYIGADASSFPGSVRAGGIFGEDYLSRLNLPGLDERMQEHLEMLKSVLQQPREVTFLTPQSDYLGKAIEASHDLNIWLNQLPAFKNPSERSMNLRPSFSMKGLRSSTLFGAQGSVVTTRLRAVSTYQDCPLKNLLRYGLQLRLPPAPRDYLRAHGAMVPALMKKSLAQLGRPFYQLSETEIAQLVHEDFSFAREIFPKEAARFDELEIETVRRMKILFARLMPVCTQMDMTLEEGSFDLSISTSNEGVSVDVEGPLTTTGGKYVSFNCYPAHLPEGMGLDFTQPAATLHLSLQPKPDERKAFHLSYGRGATPASAIYIDEQQARENSKFDFLKNAMEAQQFENPADPLTGALSKKVRTYQQREQDIEKKADSFARGLAENSFRPLHSKDACAKCSFRVICRNAAVEKGESDT